MFRDTFWLSFALTIPVLVRGRMLPRAFGYTPPEVIEAHSIPPLFGVAVVLYGGWSFVQGAVGEIREPLPVAAQQRRRRGSSANTVRKEDAEEEPDLFPEDVAIR